LCKFRHPQRLLHATPSCSNQADGTSEPQETVDKTKLKFFKIQESGFLDVASDLWAANVLMNNNNSWLVKVPTDIAPGNYVLRHEIIALHAAGNVNGAQDYPFCFNLAIDSTGTASPDGIPATQLYKATDPGIKFDLFNHPTTYIIPGVGLTWELVEFESKC
jgi:cellulase